MLELELELLLELELELLLEFELELELELLLWFELELELEFELELLLWFELALLDEFRLWLELDSLLCFVEVAFLPPSGRLTWDAPAAGKGRIKRPSSAPGGREAEGLDREIACGCSFVV